MDAAITSRPDVGRVLIAGDTHGNSAWVEGLARTAAAQERPVIIQVGDFGYFPDHRDGPRFLTTVDTVCAHHGVELWFIDGNHDDHFALAEHRTRNSPVALTENVLYLPRGVRRELAGFMFGFLGGAFSVDWRDRTLGIDWWPTEMTDAGDIARLGLRPLDVLITHDAPAGVNLSAWRLRAEDQVRADEVRSLLARAVEQTTPQVVIHGHWHHAHDSELAWIDPAVTERTGSLEWRSTRVVGLGCDGDAVGGWVVVDLQTFDIRWPARAETSPPVIR